MMADIYGAAVETRKERPLETLAHAAQRVNSAVVSISAFIDRFHGESPKEPANQDPEVGVNAPPLPYANSMERLFAAIDRLETRVDALGNIG